MQRSRFVGIVSFLVTAFWLLQAQAAIKVGYLPVTGHGKFFVAQEQGFFKAEGLDVELVEFINSADGIAALRGGKIDIGAFGTTAPLVHIAKGADLRIIGGIMGEDASIIVKPQNASAVKTVADLRGKKVATVRLATGDAVLRGALHAAAIDWKKDLEIFELKSPPAVIEAVTSGQVDAGVIWGPHDQRAAEAGFAVAIRSHDLSPGHPCCRITVEAKTLEKDPETLKRFLRAILKAEKFAADEHEKTIDAIAKYVKLDRALIAKAYYSEHLDQSTDPNLKAVREFWKTLHESEFVDSKADITPFVNVELYRSALESLAKEAGEKDKGFWAGRQKTFESRDI